MNQNNIILKELKLGKKITSLGVIKKYAITRLAARIRDLRDAGHNIETTMRTVINKQGNHTNIAVYHLQY